jgi:hypothetical protein
MAAMLLVALHFAGCTGLGPKTVARDRLDYVMVMYSFRERGVSGQAVPIVTVPTN